MTLELPCDEAARDNTSRLSVDDDEIQHLPAWQKRDIVLIDLAEHRLIRAQQQFLTCLAARVERSGDLRTAEGPVVEQAAVLRARRGTPVRSTQTKDSRLKKKRNDTR